MAEPITDEFAMASGIAALVLMQVTLEQMQQLGMPASKIDEIIARSLQIVAAVSSNQYHSALPISAKLLREMLNKRQSMRKEHAQPMH